MHIHTYYLNRDHVKQKEILKMLSYDLMSEMRHTAKTKKYFTGDMIETA